MSKIEELIQEYCPNGVKYSQIAEECTVTKGKTQISKAVPGVYPLVVTAEERKSSDAYQFDGDAVCIPLVSSRGHGVAALNHVYYQTGKFALGSILCAVIPKDKGRLDAKFLYHFLEYSKDYKLVPLMKGGANVSLHIYDVEKVEIPVPPLPVQQEIVRILDVFTEMESSLNEELELRKKQYEVYGRHIIDAIPNLNMTPLSECGKWTGGKTPSMSNKEYWDEGTIPWISSKDVKVSVLEDTEDHITQQAVIEAGAKVLPANFIATVTRSGILKHTFPVMFVPFDATINQDIKALIPRKGIIPQYVFLVMRLYAEEIRITTKKQGGTVDSLDFAKVMRFEVPVPSIEVQQEVLSKLGAFEEYCNRQLPSEITARHQQYEYYRDMLLTFKRKEA